MLALPLALVTASPAPTGTAAEQIVQAVPLWALGIVGTIIGGLVLAYLVGRFVTPDAEARKASRVAADAEARSFAGQLRNLASDVKLAKVYEDTARRGIDLELNAAKARDLPARYSGQV
jgi:hypothetical protein